MKYELINLKRHSVTIEDIGLRFDGVGSRKIIDEMTYNRSTSLKDMRHCFRINQINDSSHMPWPFNPGSVNQVSEISLTSQPAPIASSIPLIDNDGIKAICDKLDRLIDVVRDLSVASSVTVNTKSSNSSVPTNNDPVYIPSQIIPTNAEANVALRSSESIKEDIDESVNILKNLRRK